MCYLLENFCLKSIKIQPAHLPCRQDSGNVSSLKILIIAIISTPSTPNFPARALFKHHIFISNKWIIISYFWFFLFEIPFGIHKSCNIWKAFATWAQGLVIFCYSMVSRAADLFQQIWAGFCRVGKMAVSFLSRALFYFCWYLWWQIFITIIRFKQLQLCFHMGNRRTNKKESSRFNCTSFHVPLYFDL